MTNGNSNITCWGQQTNNLDPDINSCSTISTNLTAIHVQIQANLSKCDERGRVTNKDIVSDTDHDYRNDPAPLTWLGRQPQGEEGQLTGGLINEAETENAHLLLN